MCLKDANIQFQERMIEFLCSFCMVTESQEEEEDSVKKLMACVDIKAKENLVDKNLILFTRNCANGSFLTQFHRLSFRHYKNQTMGCIGDN